MRYNANTCVIELTVDELCARAHQSGHIDVRYGTHKGEKRIDPSRISALAEAGRSTCVMLRNTLTYNGITYTVEGMADAVVQGSATVEEIIFTRARTAQTDAYSRLRCLAYLFAAAHDLRRVRLRMRFYQVEAEQVSDLYSEATNDSLYAFYTSLLSRVEQDAKDLIRREEERLPTARTLRFPYPDPRPGQTELAEQVFRTIRKGGRLFAEAPTGTGKTMSVLYPAVKALGEGYCDRIFYLTAKASVRKEAYAAAAMLYEAGSRLRTVMLYAKEQMCAHPEGCKHGAVSRCDPDSCPFARGYYDRVGGAIRELLDGHHGFPQSRIREVASKHRICPYELSLDLSRYCEIIICDYNYAFSPDVYLRRYFDSKEGECGRYVFLVDEAHNLPDRARDMYSASLMLAPFEAAYARIDPQADAELEQSFGGWLMMMRRLCALCTENRVKHEDGTESGYYLNRSPLESVVQQTALFRQRLDAFLKKKTEHPLFFELSELCASLRRFVGLSEYYDERFLTYVQLESGVLTVQIYCLDPAGVLHAAMGRASATIMFSATFQPLDYFVDILGGKGARTLALPSPFDPDRLCVTVASGVSTRMEDRPATYRRVATLIAASVSAKAGNYIVFFPSYEYMERVREQFTEKYPKVECIAQRRGMTRHEQEAFLASFREDTDRMRVGFCVLGGSFSEGVDLPGSRLIGVIVVGVGIPGLSNERNMLRDYYENKCERGYDYAYIYPGMNRVLQAAGRVIRREEDKGIVVLIDARYAEPPYLSLYPSHWKGICAAGSAAALAERHRRFWEKK